MTVKKVTLKDGTTRYRFKTDTGRDPDTGKRRQTELTFDTKREAKAEYVRIRHEVGKGVYVPPTDLDVNTFLDQWLMTATRDTEKATAANYRDAMLPVRERLGGRRLQSLTEEDIEGLVDWMVTEGRKRGGKPGTGLSVRSARLTLGRLRNALELAVRRQLVVRNVAHYVHVPRSAVKAEEATKAAKKAAAEAAGSSVGPWTAAEVMTFLADIKGERLHGVLLLSLMGLRPAEVCGLRWSDVDLEAGTIKAGDNTRTLVDGVVDEKGAKSAAGKRTLPLPAPVLAALKVFKAKQAAEKLEAGEAYQSTGYVLVDEIGEPVKTDWLRRRVQKLMEQVGARRVRLYDARHSCLTYLATNGVPGAVLAAWAGHADGGALANRVYVNPDGSHLLSPAATLGTLMQ
jgi:integrase